jgi:hypothetical protein
LNLFSSGLGDLTLLFTQVRGIRILRSSFARSCIDHPPEAQEYLLWLLPPRERGLHVVVVHKDPKA